MKELRELAERATPGGELRRYVHGGGRLAADWQGRQPRLIADFYNEADREFYSAASPDVVLALLDVVEAARRLDARIAPDTEDWIALQAALDRLEVPA